MPSRVEAVSIRTALEEQVAREATAIYKSMRDKGIEPEPAARMTNGVMVCVDYVCQYKAEWFLQVPEFTKASELVLPPTDEQVIKDMIEPLKPADPAAPPARKVPRVDASRIDPKDPRPAYMPCRGCEDDKRCPDPCDEWHTFQRSLNGEPAAPKAPTPEEIYKAQNKGPAVQAAAKAPVEVESSTVCIKCGSKCICRQGHFNGVPYVYCKVCKKARKIDGQPFLGV